MSDTLTAYDRDLIAKAKQRRAKMIADGSPCCINCAFAETPIAKSEKDTSAAHYVQCMWLERTAPMLPKSVEYAIFTRSYMSGIRRGEGIQMSHMYGDDCPTFQLKPEMGE